MTSADGSSPPPTPAPATPPARQSGRIGKVVGRVAAVLFGAGVTIYAVLYPAGQAGTLGHVLQADTDVLDNALVGAGAPVAAPALTVTAAASTPAER